MRFREGIINSKSKTFLTFCFCFIFGVSLFSGMELEKYWQYRLYVVFFIIGFLLILFWKNFFWRFLLFCLLFFILGGFRFLLSVPDWGDYRNISYYNGERAEFVGVISSEPDARSDAARYVMDVSSLLSSKISVRGKVLLKLPLYPEYTHGDVLTVRCVLQSPKNFFDSNFRYDNYLARQGIFSVCVSPQVVSMKSGNYNLFFGFKKKINDRVESLWAEPNSSLVAGLLYGARGGFTPELLDSFSRVGITHIIAISGYNISIIATVLMLGLIGMGLFRRQAFWVSVAGIILFVLFTGASASVVRAGIMGVIVLLAQQLGRLSRIGNVLVFTAALMLLINPYILIWDAGFQLSFLATIGLVYLSPILRSVVLSKAKNLSRKFSDAKILRFAQNDKWLDGVLGQTLVSTFSAIIITLPLILYQFGRLSVVAPLANILVLWLIPFLMLFSFLSVIFSFLFYPLGQIIAWITGVGLNYVIILTQWLGKKSWAATEVKISLWVMLLVYVILFFILAKVYVKKNKNITIG
ncbi:MAG: ComEC/Rec2 family competence protein [Candidatus Magasanikbacteria bacterium]